MLERYTSWWFDRYPPVHGLLRFLFYGGLFYLAWQHQKSPLRGIELYVQTDPGTYRTYGLMHWLGVPYLPEETVRIIIQVVIFSWICAAIGLFTRLSTTVVGVGALFLHGIFLSTSAFNHTWYLPVYAMLLLSGIRSQDVWSIDHHLRKIWRSKEERVTGTGWRRRALLILTVGFYFSAGVSKLQDAGLAWMDGRTLAYFLDREDGDLAKFLDDQELLCMLLSIGALVIEVGSVAALVSRRMSYFFLAAWTVMLVGIRFTLGPWYFANCWCFLLLVDWPSLLLSLSKLWRGLRIAFRLAFSGAAVDPWQASQTDVNAILKARRAQQQLLEARVARRPRWTWPWLAAGTAVAAVVFLVAPFKFEIWPLTTLDMYSAYYDEDLRAGFPKYAYREVRSAQRIAGNCLGSRASRFVKKELAFRSRLQLAGPDREPLELEDGIGVASAKQWNKVLAVPVIFRDLAAKPPGRIGHDPDNPDYPAQHFLEEMLPVVRRNVESWKEYERVELIYRLRNSSVVIASVRLRPASP